MKTITLAAFAAALAYTGPEIPLRPAVALTTHKLSNRKAKSKKQRKHGKRGS